MAVRSLLREGIFSHVNGTGKRKRGYAKKHRNELPVFMFLTH